MIIQGDNNVPLRIKIEEKGELVDLGNASVEVKIKVDSTTILTKTAIITSLGECEVVLTSSDLAKVGTYKTQATVSDSNGGIYTSDIKTFFVGEKLK